MNLNVWIRHLPHVTHDIHLYFWIYKWLLIIKRLWMSTITVITSYITFYFKSQSSSETLLTYYTCVHEYIYSNTVSTFQIKILACDSNKKQYLVIHIYINTNFSEETFSFLCPFNHFMAPLCHIC